MAETLQFARKPVAEFQSPFHDIFPFPIVSKLNLYCILKPILLGPPNMHIKKISSLQQGLQNNLVSHLGTGKDAARVL